MLAFSSMLSRFTGSAPVDPSPSSPHGTSSRPNYYLTVLSWNTGLYKEGTVDHMGLERTACVGHSAIQIGRIGSPDVSEYHSIRPRPGKGVFATFLPVLAYAASYDQDVEHEALSRGDDSGTPDMRRSVYLSEEKYEELKALIHQRQAEIETGGLLYQLLPGFTSPLALRRLLVTRSFSQNFARCPFSDVEMDDIGQHPGVPSQSVECSNCTSEVVKVLQKVDLVQQNVKQNPIYYMLPQETVDVVDAYEEVV